MSAFHVGQKVVCVDAAGTHLYGIVELVQGEVYEIEWIGFYDAPKWPYPDLLCVRLRGVRRKPVMPLDSPLDPFRAARFRPVVERKTDIAIFTEMLTPTKAKERA